VGADRAYGRGTVESQGGRPRGGEVHIKVDREVIEPGSGVLEAESRGPGYCEIGGSRVAVRAQGGERLLTLYNLKMQVELADMKEPGVVVTVQANEFQRVYVLP